MAASDLKLAWESNVFELREGANLIGRKDADITIPEKSLSKEHARVIRTGPILEIEDAGSRNGTLLNDRPVAGRMSLGPGDVIKLGGCVELRVVGDGVTAAPSDAPVSARARFTVLTGELKGKVLSLSNEKPFTIGSKEENALSLKGEGISRYHAEIVFENGAWLLKDLGSRNGTFVAGRKVDLHELATGDEVQVGSVYIRFEALDGKGPLALPTDPKELVKNPKIRQAAMLAIGAIVLAFYFLRGPQPPTPPTTPTAGADVQKTVHDAIQLLDRDDSARALDLITRALHVREGQSNPTLLALNSLAKIWEDHRAPITFEWSGAADAIDKLVRGSGPQDIDADCSEWLQKMRKACQVEAPNSARRTQADTAMGKGQNALRNGQVKEGIASLEEALALYRGMPPSSVFADNARKRADEIRRILLKTHVMEGEKFVAGDRTGWDGAIAEFQIAVRYAETLDERKPIEDRSGLCELNRRDEHALGEARKIVETGDEKHYADAKELLKGINPNGRYGKDAEAALDWFQADDLVRQAIAAYNNGNWEEACSLLDKAITPTLSPAAVDQVKRRRAHWEEVHDAWVKGADAEQRGDFKSATPFYKRVVELEPWKANVYVQRAQKALQTIVDREQTEIDGAIKQGVELLDAGKYRLACDKFQQVLDRVAPDSPARGLIEDNVVRVDREKNLFKDANRFVVQNKKEKFPWVRDVLELLSRFLPQDHHDHHPAAQLLPKVK